MPLLLPALVVGSTTAENAFHATYVDFFTAALAVHTLLCWFLILQVKQAAAAVEAAWKDGIRRQRIELLLPLIGATDLDDWPGGIRQQFKAAAPLVEAILKQLKQKEGLQGPLDVDIWDQVNCSSSSSMGSGESSSSTCLYSLCHAYRPFGWPTTWGVVHEHGADVAVCSCSFNVE